MFGLNRVHLYPLEEESFSRQCVLQTTQSLRFHSLLNSAMYSYPFLVAFVHHNNSDPGLSGIHTQWMIILCQEEESSSPDSVHLRLQNLMCTSDTPKLLQCIHALSLLLVSTAMTLGLWPCTGIHTATQQNRTRQRSHFPNSFLCIL